MFPKLRHQYFSNQTHTQAVTLDRKQVHGDIRKVVVSMTTENAFATVIFESFLCFLVRN